MSTPLTLVLNENGTPHRWATWQGVATLYAKGDVIWHMGEHVWVKHGGISARTGEQTVMEIPSIISARGAYNPRRWKLSVVGQNVFRRDLNVCAYCGNHFETRFLTMDHIVPKSRGGAHSWTNIVTACKKCNSKKDNHLLEEIGWELLYVPYRPSPEEGLILKNRKILADQMDFIRKMIPRNSRLHQMEV